MHFHSQLIGSNTNVLKFSSIKQITGIVKERIDSLFFPITSVFFSRKREIKEEAHRHFFFKKEAQTLTHTHFLLFLPSFLPLRACPNGTGYPVLPKKFGQIILGLRNEHYESFFWISNNDITRNITLKIMPFNVCPTPAAFHA